MNSISKCAVAVLTGSALLMGAGAHADDRLPPPMRLDSVDVRHHTLVVNDRELTLAPDVAVYRGKERVSTGALRSGETVQFVMTPGEDRRPVLTKIWILR